MSIASREAQQFLLPLHLRRFSSADLEQALSQRGYTLVEYSRLSNDRDVALLLASLCLTEYAAQHTAFTYADKHLRIVFLQENLPEAEKQILLAHELGHICCQHLSPERIGESSVSDEQEANDFSARLLTYNRRCRVIRRILLAVVCCAVILALALFLRGHVGNEVCLTHSGACYHRPDCPFVAGKDNIVRISVSQARRAGYAPCQYCFGGGS